MNIEHRFTNDIILAEYYIKELDSGSNSSRNNVLSSASTAQKRLASELNDRCVIELIGCRKLMNTNGIYLHFSINNYDMAFETKKQLNSDGVNVSRNFSSMKMDSLNYLKNPNKKKAVLDDLDRLL